MNLVNDSFFFEHVVEIRLLLAVSAVAVGFAMIKVGSLVAKLVDVLRAETPRSSATNQLAAAGAR